MIVFVQAAYRITEGKGATYCGIGAGLARILREVRSDKRVVLTVSSRAVGIGDFPEVCFSLPRIIGSAGVLATLLPDLSEEDHQVLMDSVEVKSSAAGKLDFDSANWSLCITEDVRRLPALAYLSNDRIHSVTRKVISRHLDEAHHCWAVIVVYKGNF
jgi:hypothetical protein